MRTKAQYFFNNIFVYSFILLIVYWIIPISSVQAAGEFNADYDVEYAVSPAGTTIVTQNITLTNALTNLYPKQYSILLDTTRIKNVIAYDSRGVITPEITQKDNKTQILLNFNDRVVGIGKKLIFTLRFENEDIAKKLGSIWEINIPGVADDQDLHTYYVTLKVPSTFGPNAYMTPLPGSGKRWNKEQMTHGGISAAYGLRQIFSLSLSYFLENNTLTPKTYEIALPPDTAFQKVNIEHIEPRPQTVKKDIDGNWIAFYEITPQKKVPIEVKMSVTTTLSSNPSYQEHIDDLSLYTRSLKHWESKDPQIVDLARTYSTPKSIYDYVRQTLSYDYARANQNPIRKGALQILASPKSAICMEFTDLFVAIARAAGIPAREVVGFAYTTNTKLRPLSLVRDVLHAWPQYYDVDQKLWISIDPTWANTTGGINYFDKLDFNHIVFAIHGVNSENPYPAGFYKQAGKVGKDVLVEFSEKNIETQSNKLSVSYNIPKIVTAGFSTKGSIVISNDSGVSVQDVDIHVQSVPIDVTVNQHEYNMPPFSSLEIPISFTIANYLLRQQGRITTIVSGEMSNYYFDIQPSYWLLVPVIGIITVILIAIVVIVKIPRHVSNSHS